MLQLVRVCVFLPVMLLFIEPKRRMRMAPSSSGPGRQVLILKIAGSTPAGVTKA